MPLGASLCVEELIMVNRPANFTHRAFSNSFDSMFVMNGQSDPGDAGELQTKCSFLRPEA